MSGPLFSSSSAAVPTPSQATAELELVSRADCSDMDALKAWHRGYTAVGYCWRDHAATKAVQSDKLDYDLIETRVQQLLSSANVSQGFCAECRHLFDNWPVPPIQRDSAIGRHFHTQEIESAAKAGCKCCAFLLSTLERRSTLDLFRKIEMRLHDLGENETASLSIQNQGKWAGGRQKLWVNWPGKIEREDGAATPGYTFCSDIMEPTCK